MMDEHHFFLKLKRIVQGETYKFEYRTFCAVGAARLSSNGKR